MNIYYIPPKQIINSKPIFQEAKDKFLKIKNKKRRNQIAMIIIGIALSNINELLAKDLKINEFTKKVNSVGNQALELIQVVGYWAAIIFAGIDVIKNIKKQDIAGIISIVLKYVVMSGVLYGLPWIFDVFRELFS